MFNAFSFQAPPAAGLPVSELEYAARMEYAGDTLAVFGNTLVLEDGPAKFYDISDPMNPAPLGSSVPCFRDVDEFDVDSGNNLLATSSGHNTLELWDVSDPASPVRLYQGKPTDSSDFGALAVGGGTLLIQSAASDDRNSYLFDVSDPTAPVRLDKNGVEGDGCGIDYPYGWLMGYNDFYVYDLSGGAFDFVDAAYNITNFYGRKRYDPATGVVTVFNYLDEVIHLIDWSDKTAPTKRGIWPVPDRGENVPVGNRLWVATGTRLQEVDISDLDNPKKVNEWTFRQCERPYSPLLYHRGVLFNGYLYEPNRYDDFHHVQPMQLPTLETNVVSASTVLAGDVEAQSAGVTGPASVGQQLAVGGPLTAKGGQRPRRRGVAASADVGASDFYVAVTDTSAAWTLTLAAPRTQSREHIIKDESGAASTNAITIATVGAQTIDGAATASISTDYGSVHLISDGDNWYTV